MLGLSKHLGYSQTDFEARHRWNLTDRKLVAILEGGHFSAQGLRREIQRGCEITRLQDDRLEATRRALQAMDFELRMGMVDYVEPVKEFPRSYI